MVFFANNKNGKLIFEAPTKLEKYIETLPDCRVSIVMKRWRKPRSLDQNAYYWKCLEIAAESLGYDREEYTIVLKQCF